MPLYRIRNTIGAWGIRAFLNVEAGVTRGAAPDPEQQIADLRRTLAQKDRELKAARKRVERRGAVTRKEGEVSGPRRSPSEEAVGGEAGTRSARTPSCGRSRQVRGEASENGVPAFFIVGSEKSGTTWLMRLLNFHPEIFCWGEGRFFDRHWHRPDLKEVDTRVPPRSLYGALYHSEDLRLWIERSVQRDKEGTEKDLAVEKDLASLAGAVIGHFFEQRRSERGKAIVGDKTPLYDPDTVKEIAEVCPGAKVIHIIRDGRDVQVSLTHHRWNRSTDRGGIQVLRPGEAERREAYHNDPRKLSEMGMFDEDTLRSMARSWRSLVGTVVEDGPNLLGQNYAEARYESLLENTSAELERLLKFLGGSVDEPTISRCVDKASFETMSDGRRRGEEDPASFLRKGVAGDWKNVFTTKDKRIFKQEAGDLLVQLGYENNDDW